MTWVRNLTKRKYPGLTLIEIVVVLGVFAILVALTTPYTMDYYRTYALQSDRNILLSLLEQARSFSLATTGNANHGVAITSTSFVGFEGASYATRDISKDITFPRNGAVAVTGPTEVVFQVRTGNASNATLTVSSGGKSDTITTNTAGMIDWQ